MRVPAMAACRQICPAISRASAQAFPTKPVRIVVPYTTGGVSDITARLIAEPRGRGLVST